MGSGEDLPEGAAQPAGQIECVESVGLHQYSWSVLDPMLRRWAHDQE